MTATYDETQISTSTLFQVRFLVQDTDTANAKLQDEEINWLNTEESNVYFAAAMAATQIAMSANKKANREVGDLKIEYSKQADEYSQLARTLRTRGNIRGSMPWMNAHKKSRKTDAREDSDRVQPFIERGMDDNTSLDDTVKRNYPEDN